MAEWSTAEINNLPDSSFAYIEPGGTKDDSGKTTPRSLRHLPYKDAAGKVDHAHVVNGIQRLPQTHGIPASEVNTIRTKLQNALKQAHATELGEKLEANAEAITLSATGIQPDANGELPKRFPLLVTFDLPNSNRGHFQVTPQDLYQIKEKLEAGIGFPSSDTATGLAGDFEHNGHKEAAFWMHKFDVVPDPTDDSKATLFADDVDWTDAGAEAVRGGRYKMVSPTGAFGRKNGKLNVYPWHTDLSDKLSNFICGAGLTNEPFQSMMAPVRLSANGEKLDSSDTAYDKVMFVYDEQKNKEPSMTMNLDELRVKPREELSVPELDFVTEHQDELSAPERTKFKLDATSEEYSDEDKQTLAAIKDGSKKVIDANAQTADTEKLDRLESTVERYRKQEVMDFLDSQVKRGAIKQDQAKIDGYWGKQLLGAGSDADMQAVKDALEALPSNEQLSQEIGHGEDQAAGSTAREQMDKLAWAKVREAEKNGKELLYRDALKQVYKEHEDLKTQDKQELTRTGA